MPISQTMKAVDQVADGRLPVKVGRVFGLDDIVEAHRDDDDLAARLVRSSIASTRTSGAIRSKATASAPTTATRPPMRRQYVHLTPDAALARSVGSRHGKPCLVRVDARSAHEAGTVFHQANAAFWLVRSIEPRLLSVDADSPSR